MRRLVLVLAAVAVAGCADFPWGSPLGTCRHEPGAQGAAVAVRAVLNETTELGAAGAPARGACVHASPADAPPGSGDLSRQARVDEQGRATLRLDEALAWRVYALVQAPRDRYCGYLSETAEVQPVEGASVELHVSTGSKLCA